MTSAPLVMVVDDEAGVRDILEEFVGSLGYRVLTADSAEEALRRIESTLPDIILTDVNMPGMSGVELTRRLKADPRLQLVPVVILTAVADLDARVAGLAAGADDFFAKPVEFIELRTRLGALARLKSLVDQLERAERVITALGLTIEARDPYTGGHCVRLSEYGVALGRALGVDADQERALGLAGYLHDLGKIAVPDHILLKPGRLDEGEQARIRTHPAVGADLVAGMRSLEAVRPLIRHHHERLDGSGYPDGLRGDQIPIGVRIVAVVDVFDALNTARPYKPAVAPVEALRVLRREADDGAWDPRVVEALAALLRGRGLL
jgi:putative two-component system response regulator